MNWHVYLAECSDGSLYCGITKNLENRMQMHNSGKGGRYTRAKGPVKLVYTEEYQSHKEAAQREVSIKGLSREKKLNLVKYKKEN
jgi:putative endonuclease